MISTSPVRSMRTMANSFVRAVSSDFVDEVFPNPHPHQQGPGIISIVEFSITDVKKLLDLVNSDCAVGTDNLQPVLLKKCSSSVAYPFYRLFKQSLSSGTAPDLRKHSIVTPIFKEAPVPIHSTIGQSVLPQYLVPLLGGGSRHLPQRRNYSW